MQVKVTYPPDADGDRARSFQYEAKAKTPVAILNDVYHEFNRIDGNQHVFSIVPRRGQSASGTWWRLATIFTATTF